MRVLIISLDRTLLGIDYSGDALERHQEYAEQAGKLDIIVFSKSKSFKKKKISPELTVYSTNSTSKINYIFNAYNIAKNIYWPDKFDLIVCQDPFLTGLTGWLIKKRFKVPLLIHFHGDFWENKYWLCERWFNPVFLFLGKFLVKGADGIRVVSSIIKDKLIEDGVDKKKIRVIPTPVDLERFENFDEEKVNKFRKKHDPDRKVIINVGRHDPSKDYKTLYKAISLVYEDYKKLAFWQIGNKDYLPEKIKGDQNLILTSIGKIKQEELVNYYHASDIYVSSSCHESFGKVLIEAMACGLPVIATETTGSKEIIRDGVNGYLVPIEDSEALAKKILFLLNNPDKAEEIGQAGRKMVKGKFNHEKIIKEIIKFWNDLT
ncbi:glycosyltransferase family 4 protein [Patescibacteria group bacterium]|nr:glycosyltransferase family 4 protein [Patescibacteria group bacterium]MBU2472949.1 glycosyltransferase family 4 protein [Patescibacteria group bacterium]